ncbi:MAG TPA: hypothetical protein VF761_04865 [Gemmatimonadaceae bacterium]
MRKLAALLTSLVLGAPALHPQSTAPIFELRPFAGVSIPTSRQSTLYGESVLFGAQAGLEIKPTFHVLATLTWIPAHYRLGVSNPDVNLYQYDVGTEFGIAAPMEPEWVFKPFLGLGAGGRTYSFRASEMYTRTGFAAYGSAGTELQLHRVAFRFEVRDNVFRYRDPIGARASWMRNDVAFSLGLAYHFR